METLLNLISGPLGALLMVLGGLGAPCGVALAVYGQIQKSPDKRFLRWGIGLTVFCMGTMVGMFILRALIATFFTMEPLDP